MSLRARPPKPKIIPLKVCKICKQSETIDKMCGANLFVRIDGHHIATIDLCWSCVEKILK